MTFGRVVTAVVCKETAGIENRFLSLEEIRATFIGELGRLIDPLPVISGVFNDIDDISSKTFPSLARDASKATVVSCVDSISSYGCSANGLSLFAASLKT